MIKKGTRVKLIKKEISASCVLKEMGVWEENGDIYGEVVTDYEPSKNRTCRIKFSNGKCISYYSYRFEIADESARIKPRGHLLTKMFQLENSKK